MVASTKKTKFTEVKSRDHWLYFYTWKAGLPVHNATTEDRPLSQTPLKQGDRKTLLSTSKSPIFCLNLSLVKSVSNSYCKEHIICIESMRNKLWTASPREHIDKIIWQVYENSVLKKKEWLIQTRDLDLEA